MVRTGSVEEEKKVEASEDNLPPREVLQRIRMVHGFSIQFGVVVEKDSEGDSWADQSRRAAAEMSHASVDLDSIDGSVPQDDRNCGITSLASSSAPLGNQIYVLRAQEGAAVRQADSIEQAIKENNQLRALSHRESRVENDSLDPPTGNELGNGEANQDD